jgi:hypothetical protein
LSSFSLSCLGAAAAADEPVVADKAVAVGKAVAVDKAVVVADPKLPHTRTRRHPLRARRRHPPAAGLLAG